MNRMNTAGRLLALIMTVLFVLIMAACGEKDDNNKSEAGQTGSFDGSETEQTGDIDDSSTESAEPIVTKEDMEAYESGIASAESAMETATTAVTDNNIISGSETGTMATDYTTAVTTPATTIDLDEFFQ